MDNKIMPQTTYEAVVQFLTDIVDDMDMLVTDELLDDESSWAYDYNAWTALLERAADLLEKLDSENKIREPAYYYPCFGNRGSDDAPPVPYVTISDRIEPMNPGTRQPTLPDTIDMPAGMDYFTTYRAAAEYAMLYVPAAIQEIQEQVEHLQTRVIKLQNGILDALDEGIPTDPHDHPENHRAVGRLMVAMYPGKYPEFADWMREWFLDEDGNDLYNGPEK